MAITFNDVWHNVKGCAYYDASQPTDVLKHTIRGSSGNVYNVDVFPDSGVAVGDAFLFAFNYDLAGKSNQLRVNLDVGIAGTGITGVWEYTVGGTNNAPSWSALSVISDGTAGLTATGLNTLSFTVPSDWDNYHFTSISSNIYYCFTIRYRITGITTWTEGGHIANVSGNCQGLGYTIHVSGYGSGAPCTLTDIYNADVAGGWGVVTKTGNQFSFACNLRVGNACYVRTLDEMIQFENNWFLLMDTGTTAVWQVGEVYSGDKVRRGSSFVFLGTNCNYPLLYGFAGVDSAIYNAQFKHVVLSSTVGFNGYWGGGLGENSRQKLFDVYIQGFRQTKWHNTANTIIGVVGGGLSTGACHVEAPGAIIKSCKIFGGTNAMRPGSTTARANDYIHECDIGGTTYPINPYTSTDLATFALNCVDCDWGVVTDANKARWNHSSSPNASGDHKVKLISSFLLRALDKTGAAIAGATATLTDKTGATAFTVTSNADGYFGSDSGTMTGATADYLQDSSKSWTTDQWWFREFLVTSGAGVGQRRIVKKGNTATQLDAGWSMTTTPSIGDRFILVPYVTWKYLVPSAYTPSAAVASTATDLNPFTLTVSKAGYETYTMKMTLSKKVDMEIKLYQSPRIDLSSGRVVKNIKDGVCVTL